MLSIRMQRLGRKGHPTYRIVVQDSRLAPTSGKYVALLGSYDPHTKVSTLVKDKAKFYLEHGAQPSDRVAQLFKTEGVKLPEWVKLPTKQTREIRNAEKLRKNRPAEAVSEPAPAEEQTSVEPEMTKTDDIEAPEVGSTDESTKETAPKADQEETAAEIAKVSEPEEPAPVEAEDAKEKTS